MKTHAELGNLNYAYEIMNVAREDQTRDYDSCFCIVGKERIGKSNLLLHCLEYLGITPDQINVICLEGEDFIIQLYQAKSKGITALDEAGDSMFSRDAMTKQTKNFIKAYQAIGGKRLITFLVLPSFFRLDRYFREDRVRGLFYVYRRGSYVYYSPAQIKKIIKQGYIKLPPQKSYKRKYFPAYKGKLLPPYLELKKKKIQSILKKMQPEHKEKNIEHEIVLRMDAAGKTQQEIGQALGKHHSTISKILKRVKKAKTGFEP